jgi:transcriptional regulator with XRE-family HTH domain
MQPPVFVKNLFALLRTLGVTQQAVAASLGVSKGLVSLWAQGKVPIPQHHLRPFFELVANTIDNALPPAERHMMTGADLSPTPSPRRLLQHSVDEYLDLWLLEQYAQRGRLERDYQSAYNVLMSYRTQHPSKLDAAQREEINEACRTIQHANRALERLHEPPRPLEFNDLRLPHTIPDDVLSYLWGIAGYHRAWGTPPPGSEQQEDNRNDA